MKINVLTRRPKEWGKTMLGHTKNSIWAYKGPISGKIQRVSDDPADVVPGSRMVIIASPNHVREDILERAAPHLSEDTMVGSVYGSGGFDLMGLSVLGESFTQKNITLFSLQYVPFLCKILKYGSEVNFIGPKSYMLAAAYPNENTLAVSETLGLLYSIPVVGLPNFLTLLLTPSNQIIHPGRVYGYFRDWDGKRTWAEGELPKVYEDMDDPSADEIQKLDDELQAIKKEIRFRWPQVDLSLVVPIKHRIETNYADQVSDRSSLQRVFATNKGYRYV